MSTREEQLEDACSEGRLDEAKQLIKNGVDVDWRDETFGNTSLMWAARYGHVNVIQLLLDHGANINSKNNVGNTLLHWAACNGHVEAVKLLIERGADLHVKDNIGGTPLDDAKENEHSSIAAIIEAAMKSTKVIYTSSQDLQQNIVTFIDFNNNIIIISDNDVPDRFEFEGHPTFTFRHMQQCIDQLPSPTADNEDNIPPNNLHNILEQRHPGIAQRLQSWGMNILHLIAYYRSILSNDTHKALSSILTNRYPQAATAVDIDGMTPLHHAVINLQQKRISQECYDILLAHSPPIVVHKAIEAGMEWEYLCPIVMAKLNALTLEDEENGLVPFMLAAEICNNDDGVSGSLNGVYELLCLRPDVLKEYE